MSYHTDIFTYFTKPTGLSELLYSAESWINISLVLETAGPVAVSTRQDVTPVLSGKGILLAPDGEPTRFVLPRGDRLYIAAEAVNRVKVVIEPFPWIEQILLSLENNFQSLGGLLRSVVSRKPAPEKKQDIPCPPSPSTPFIRR